MIDPGLMALGGIAILALILVLGALLGQFLNQKPPEVATGSYGEKSAADLVAELAAQEMKKPGGKLVDMFFESEEEMKPPLPIRPATKAKRIVVYDENNVELLTWTIP